MRSWKAQQQQQAEVPSIPMQLSAVSPAGVPFECISCVKSATMLFEGSSYCRDCLREQLRTGILRRFYNAE